jgi:hypothetical protein
LGFFARVWLAFVCFFRIAFDREFAERVAPLRLPAGEPYRAALPQGPADPRRARPRKETAAPLKRDDDLPLRPALRLLALLQREGRLVDFCEEELGGFPDAQVGAAARAVHAGCRKALREAFAPVAVRDEPEGAAVVLESGFDPEAVRLTGNVAGSPPFRGTLRHHGWRASTARLPIAEGDAMLLAPAEVEL